MSEIDLVKDYFIHAIEKCKKMLLTYYLSFAIHSLFINKTVYVKIMRHDGSLQLLKNGGYFKIYLYLESYIRGRSSFSVINYCVLLCRCLSV